MAAARILAYYTSCYEAIYGILYYTNYLYMSMIESQSELPSFGMFLGHGSCS